MPGYQNDKRRVITEDDPADNEVNRKIRGPSRRAADSTTAGRDSVASVAISLGASWPASVAVDSVPAESAMITRRQGLLARAT